MPSELAPKTLRVPEGIPRLLRDLIHDRTGLFFEDSRMDYLIDKLEPVALSRGFNSFLEYYYALKEDQHGEWDRAWEALSVQETYFWREMSQIETLVGVLVPEWRRRNQRPYHIWSAAGLERAQLGVYRERSFRTLPPSLRQKYFEPVAGGWRLCDNIRGRVMFSRANLQEPADVAALARAEAIFCRNVFIYFSRHAIRQTVAMMAAKMPPGGHLFVGAAESLVRLTADFELKEIGGALAYQRQ
jgi:chemotaxis protein methyltransferase CheR